MVLEMYLKLSSFAASIGKSEPSVGLAVYTLFYHFYAAIIIRPQWWANFKSNLWKKFCNPTQKN